MRATPLIAFTVLLGCFTPGCVRETWTYRVAHDVNVISTDTSVRPGAVTLFPADSPMLGAAPVPEVRPGLSDAALKEKLAARMTAERELTKLRDTLGENHADVVAQKQKVAAIDGDIAEATQQAAAHQRAMASAPKGKTVLVIALDHVGPGPIRTSLGGDLLDRYSRMLVMIIDEPLPKETIWATGDNSILISYSPYTPPQRTYVGVEGSVKIVSVSDGNVVADVAVQTRGDVDDTDADFFRIPWATRGRRTFTVATPQDPLFKTGALRWGSPAAHPTTQPIAGTARGE